MGETLSRFGRRSGLRTDRQLLVIQLGRQMELGLPFTNTVLNEDSITIALRRCALTRPDMFLSLRETRSICNPLGRRPAKISHTYRIELQIGSATYIP